MEQTTISQGDDAANDTDDDNVSKVDGDVRVGEEIS